MISKQIHVKKQIHQGSASSQGKRKNTYQLWKCMNIRCSGHMHRSHSDFWMVVYDKTIFFHRANYGHFGQLRLVSIRCTLNQTQRCSAVRSHLFELINHLFELARERERERESERQREGWKLRVWTCVCASLSTSNDAYFKNCDFTPSMQRNITLRVSSLSKLFYYYKCLCCVSAARSLWYLCAITCVCASMKAAKPAYSFSLATNPSPTRARSYPLNINPNPTQNPKVSRDPSGSGRVADL